jgi:phosphatidylinositol phospholipase C gamma-1
MFEDYFDPYDRSSLANSDVEPLALSIRIMAARHLTKLKKSGVVCPFVEIEVFGADYDCIKCKTQTVRDNGLNPYWKEVFVIDVANPDLALIRFVINDEDMFGDPNFLGQATYPVRCLRTGYRSITLRNEYSEELELASLLIHLDIKNARENEAIYTTIQQLRDQSRKITKLIEQAERVGQETEAEKYRKQLQAIDNQLRIKNEERNNSSNGNHHNYNSDSSAFALLSSS